MARITMTANVAATVLTWIMVGALALMAWAQLRIAAAVEDAETHQLVTPVDGPTTTEPLGGDRLRCVCLRESGHGRNTKCSQACNARGVTGVPRICDQAWSESHRGRMNNTRANRRCSQEENATVRAATRGCPTTGLAMNADSTSAPAVPIRKKRRLSSRTNAVSDCEAWALRSQRLRSTLSQITATASSKFSLMSHPQKRRTSHPACLSRAVSSASLRAFCSTLSCQKSAFVCGRL